MNRACLATISLAHSLFAEQCFHELLSRHAKVFSYVSEDGTQRADPKRPVSRDSDVVLALLCGREPM
jgi:hypothetical protein